MSIRSGILFLLGTADAYGLQIHGELEERTDRIGRINVGQIYSTLDRLSTAGLVRIAGSTDDGLPLYGLTADGRLGCDAWLAETAVDTASAWPDMVFKVLLVTSLDEAAGAALLARYRHAWHAHGDEAGPNSPVTQNSPAALAHGRLADAALGWIDDLESLPGGLATLGRPLRNERPRRGRRPAPTTAEPAEQ
ncbi:PadR family transcriptional regulator [Herbiconiux sp. YIM B11900]|uniref:PadR family transcriptional regulator n=1 Tax=Herbiconiux sp. YIM B11900 TaxID=3404131 RepID=UPI003F878C0F